MKIGSHVHNHYRECLPIQMHGLVKQQAVYLLSAHLYNLFIYTSHWFCRCVYSSENPWCLMRTVFNVLLFCLLAFSNPCRLVHFSQPRRLLHQPAPPDRHLSRWLWGFFQSSLQFHWSYHSQHGRPCNLWGSWAAWGDSDGGEKQGSHTALENGDKGALAFVVCISRPQKFLILAFLQWLLT